MIHFVFSRIWRIMTGKSATGGLAEHARSFGESRAADGKREKLVGRVEAINPDFIHP
jgi:hypothetical protein